MSKTLLFLLLLLFILLGIFFSVRKQFSDKTALQPLSPTIPTQNNSRAALSLQPATVVVVAGRRASVNISIDSKNPPQIMQLEMKYDPLLLDNVQISPGDFFDDPEVVLDVINNDTGRISYGIRSGQENNDQKLSGTIAILSFTPKFVFQNTTVISFLPKTEIRAAHDANILSATYDAKITIASSSGK